MLVTLHLLLIYLFRLIALSRLAVCAWLSRSLSFLRSSLLLISGSVLCSASCSSVMDVLAKYPTAHLIVPGIFFFFIFPHQSVLPVAHLPFCFEVVHQVSELHF